MGKDIVEFRYSGGVKKAGINQKTLVSALIGTSTIKGYDRQVEKIQGIASMLGNQKPDIVSDLSIVKLKQKPLYELIIKDFPEFIVSTLPIYTCQAKNYFIDEKELLDIIRMQAETGVSMITIHPTANETIIRKAQQRMVPWTSRGGGIIIRDLLQRNFKVENAYLRILDEIIKIAIASKIVISIGATFRSANIFDSMDETQIEEFKIQKEISDYISNEGVNVIIEGPGHSSPKKLKAISEVYSKMGYPIMPLGPIPTDTAIGYDHISSSIGAAILGMHSCAHILTAVTREEHTGGIPTAASTIEAIIASKIAAHIIDLNNIEDSSSDFKIAKYRAEFQTCVYGKRNAGCSRCLDVCPLNMMNTF